MPNKYVNKVVIGKETKLDLTADTITPDKLAKGITAHDKSGAPITGTSTKDADTSDATAAVAEVLNGKTFYARGAKMTGTMPNNGEVNGEISTVSGKYTIPMGFHDGAGGGDHRSDRTGQAGAHKYPRGRYGPGRERLYERQRRYEAAGQERYADL